jgi:hypothetical protein
VYDEGILTSTIRSPALSGVRSRGDCPEPCPWAGEEDSSLGAGETEGLDPARSSAGDPVEQAPSSRAAAATPTVQADVVLIQEV